MSTILGVDKNNIENGIKDMDSNFYIAKYLHLILVYSRLYSERLREDIFRDDTYHTQFYLAMIRRYLDCLQNLAHDIDPLTVNFNLIDEVELMEDYDG